ncbi:hypothetical protein BTA51_14960 [Hahella sp. CCB-MM4]|uniref:hypothetical protein n=1 Tax=Hahella sp. (strain CCB-MM4) TaxID=1926491 RepID=UPI000B9C354C|nr:hypothetical protein [Hahella sp. CCB-MM4]OZG72428.1 hypothetical protein BTA51_14960 [Hahella sp. CCB-MM4]
MKRLLLLLLVTETAIAGELSWNLTLSTTLSETINTPEEDARYFESFFQLDRFPQEESPTRWSLREDYRSFHQPKIDNHEPASNGDAHALSLRWFAHFSQWQIELAPTIATSSNVLVHPDEMKLEDWQLHGSLLRSDTGPAAGQWQWGVIADSRFGRYLPYPSVQWQKNVGNTQIGLGLPNSDIAWRFRSDWSVGLEVGPDGGFWHVRDKNFRQSSDLSQKRWNASLYLQWSPPYLQWSPVRLASFRLGLNHYWRQEWKYQLDDGQSTYLSIPDLDTLQFSLFLSSW